MRVNLSTQEPFNQVPLTCSDASKYSDHIEYHLLIGDANMSQKHNIYVCDRV